MDFFSCTTIIWSFLALTQFSTVIFYKFSNTGLDKDNVIRPGFGIKAPWNDLYKFDITDNLIEETIDVLDGSGLSINVDVTMNYHLKYDSVGEIYETYQFDYNRRLIRPVFRSTVRDVMGRYTAEEIYSTKRAEVENLIQAEASEVLAKPGNNIVMKSCDSSGCQYLNKDALYLYLYTWIINTLEGSLNKSNKI